MNTSQTRYIPSNSVKIARDGVPAVVYMTKRDTRTGPAICGIGYSGSRSKHDFHFSFSTQARFDEYVARFFDGVAERIARKAAQAAEKTAARAAGHGLNVGDILYTCWGYEQTNIDWYQVTEAKTGKSVILRRIAAKVTEVGFMQGPSLPCPNEFAGEAFRAIFNGRGVKADGHHASKWDGKPKNCSWYA